MKKNVFYLILLFLLIGCNGTNEENQNRLEESKNSQTEASKATLKELEALDIAKTLIENTLAVFDEAYYISEDYPTDEQLMAQLQKASTYATDSFIKDHLFIKDYSCTDASCPSVPGMLMSFSKGWRESIELKNNKEFYASAVYPSFKSREYFQTSPSERENDQIQSYRQTVKIVLVDGTWKLDTLMNVDEDMNLQQHEIEPYVRHLGYNFNAILPEEVKQVINQQETVYRFFEEDYWFEIIARTGFISYSGGLDVSAYDDIEWEEEGEIFRASDKPYLDYFYDIEPYKDRIDTSNSVVGDIVNELNHLDATWIEPPYYEEQREQLLTLRKGYYDLYYKTFSYLAEKYPDEMNITKLNEYFDGLEAGRTQYFHQYSIYAPFVTSESVEFIADDAWIYRNFIFDLLVNEVEIFKN